MSRPILKFAKNCIIKCTFHCSKYPFNTDNVNVEKIIISNKFPCGNNNFKYFIGLRCGEKITSLRIENERVCKEI